ncbi:hypothetical protein [Dokdonia sinensis]|uniref:hypothetical protein n=1 Tax=Dokdonia sinensis TaxID=2479847 RepID=UPI00191C3D1E|nr:hypothetical protein [Dokdonia sinensis]
MEVTFTTKEESNKLQEKAFLALSPSERFLAFLNLSIAIQRLHPTEFDPKENFVLKKKK